MFWSQWAFAFTVTAPNLLLLLVGVLLRRLGWLDDVTCDKVSQLVFKLALPCLLFFSIATNHTPLSENLPLAIYGAAATVVTFLILEGLAPFLVKDRRERGIFVQGGFRANTAIVGIAYCSNAYGSQGIAIASLYIAATVILFNVLSVVTLTRSLQTGSESASKGRLILMGIMKNPLIISIVLGLLYAFSGLPLPNLIVQTGHDISSIALPLALLCAGASLSVKSMFRSSSVAATASLARLLLVPFMLTMGGWLFGFRGMPLGVIFLFATTPTAAASYVMTRAMGGNATLAANIIALTTIGSFFTTSIGLYFLHGYGII